MYSNAEEKHRQKVIEMKVKTRRQFTHRLACFYFITKIAAIVAVAEKSIYQLSSLFKPAAAIFLP
jgi:hypothetical protein